MSGHSKWSKVKHQKATTDVVKAAAFTRASHGITIAVREGGGADPDRNFHLRLAIEKARDVNMPKENIERAIAKAEGAGGLAIEQIILEGYGPGGIAILVEAATDNRQRTVSQVKNVLERSGGSLAEPGAVSFQFARRGVLTIHKTGQTLDSLVGVAIDAGADDVTETIDLFEVYTNPKALHAVKKIFEEKGIAIENAVLIMHPTMSIPVSDAHMSALEEITNLLSELSDVQSVYTNVAN